MVTLSTLFGQSTKLDASFFEKVDLVTEDSTAYHAFP